MYRFVLFDLDGTLTDSREGIFNSVRYSLDKLGRPCPPYETLLRFVGPPLHDSFERYCGMDAQESHRAVNVFRERYETIGWAENKAAPGMVGNLREMSRLKVPVICTVIGEGGSGGALAIGVGDKVNMLQYSTYSVISPEGCASILWKSADKAPLAAEAMGIIAPRLKELKLIDSIIPEPLGGAHRKPEVMAASLKAQLLADLADLDVLSKEDLLNRRYQRLMTYGYA